MFCKKVNTIKAYQIIICLTNKNMMNSGKFTGGSNNGRYAASEPNLFTLYFAAAKKHSNRQSGLFTNKR